MAPKISIAEKFGDGSGRKRIAPFLTCGFPNMDDFVKLALSVAKSDVDFLEVGLPFSDPLADGPTIQYSSAQSLKNGFTLEKGFKAIAEISADVDIPIIVMTYLNNILAIGKRKFARMCHAAGVAGIIVPDLPFDYIGDFKKLCVEYSIDVILLATPTTPTDRIRAIAETSSGFLYLVSVRGITGSRKSFPPGTISFIKSSRKLSPIPTMVGFGISGPSLASQVSAHSDGVIIGSALIDIIRQNPNIRKASAELRSFLLLIREAIAS